MFRKSKIEPVEKVKIVERYLAGEIGIQQAGKELGVDHHSIRNWISIYQYDGPTGLLNQPKNKSYSKDLKISAINDYLNGEGSLQDICTKYGIRSHRQLSDWIKVYNSGGILKTSTGGAYMKKAKNTTLDERLKIVTDCLAMCRGFSTDGMMEAFSRWYNMAEYTPFGEVFDIGGTTRLAIQRYLMGESVNDCGSSDVYSNGNGSLMRMLPMILYLDVTPINSNAVDLIYKVSGLTHAHLISKIACVYYVYIGMYLTVYSDKNEAMEEAIKAVDEYYKDTVYPDTRLGGLSRVFTLSEEDIKSSGYVVDSLEASIWCLYNSNSYTEAVLRAVNLGEDTDTIGAITGSLAGLFIGGEHLPKEWVDSLQAKDKILQIVDRFYEQYK